LKFDRLSCSKPNFFATFWKKQNSMRIDVQTSSNHAQYLSG
jgi:hypothetical protein